eukprot:4858008-Prymnesium_polylepis.1
MRTQQHQKVQRPRCATSFYLHSTCTTCSGSRRLRRTATSTEFTTPFGALKQRMAAGSPCGEGGRRKRAALQGSLCVSVLRGATEPRLCLLYLCSSVDV